MPAILLARLPLDVRYDTSHDGWPGLSLDAVTIAESLKALGFVTGAITNYWYFDRNNHMDQGVDEYDNEDAKLRNTPACRTRAPSRRTAACRCSRPTRRSRSSIAICAQRWFLWVHDYDPHFAYEPHSEVPSFGTDRMALYDGEIRFTDMHIGRLLDGLRARGLSDKTVVA